MHNKLAECLLHESPCLYRRKGAISHKAEATKLSEGIAEEAREAGRKEGENNLAKLMSFLIRDGKTEALNEILANEAMRSNLYLQYGIHQ